MLREEDIREERGWCTDEIQGAAGTYIRIVHVPTGISRAKGPLAGESGHAVVQMFLREIEEELIAKGLSSYIVPAYKTKRTLKRHRA